ncbi:MAG TPA: isocitrate/isopropylmalate family dehydrogenase [bacterium]|nr:isocitrate/isopropylmalate family dehydrogenase [bacterium]
MPTRVTLIPGDGIGPEISTAVRQILDAAGADIAWEPALAGKEALDQGLPVLPEATVDAIEGTGVALKGPLMTPSGGGHRSANVTLRVKLDLYANVRPAVSLAGLVTPFPDVNLLLVRENTEGSYAGIEHMQTPDVAQSLKIITRSGSARVIRFALELARKRGRTSVTCVHKANIMKLTDGLFLDTFRQVAAEYPDLETRDMLVDNCCMQLVTRPGQFQVLVMPNLYGDILSDLCAGLVGGLGVAPSAQYGTHAAVFEAVHGTAPDIAGKGVANPTALLMASVSMLRHIGKGEIAERVKAAITEALQHPEHRTRDLGGTAGTQEYTDYVCGLVTR